MADIPDRSGPGEDPWLTVQQVSEELKIHPATVRVWIKSGRLRRCGWAGLARPALRGRPRARRRRVAGVPRAGGRSAAEPTGRLAADRRRGRSPTTS